METAREQVAALVGAAPAEVVFTSGGTEADNLAVKGTLLARPAQDRHLVCSAVEHHAVLDAAAWAEADAGARVDLAPVDGLGRVELDRLGALLQPGRTALVAVMAANNEVGTGQPVAVAAELAHGAGALCAVDNTFATPFLQRPLELGADLVVHSSTKYLGGHSDVVGGALVTRLPELHERAKFLQNAVGAVPGPMDCWLTLRGVKTLALRMRAHCHNAMRVAAFLAGRPEVAEVRYPGLPTDPGHELAARQMAAFGGMVAFRPAGGLQAARRLVAATEVFTLAESLGGVESLIELPGEMTHASVAGTDAEVPADLVRLSVGIEHPDDLVADLAGALERA